MPNILYAGEFKLSSCGNAFGEGIQLQNVWTDPILSPAGGGGFNDRRKKNTGWI